MGGPEKTKLIAGFDDKSSAKTIYNKVYSDIFYLLLLYDTLVIDLLSVPYFVDFFGFKDFIYLLNHDCIKVIFDSGFQSVLAPNESLYEAIFIHVVQKDKSFDNIKILNNKLKNIIKSNEYLKPTLYLVEKNSLRLQSENISTKIHSEIDYDLLNQNITKSFNISAQNKISIPPSDAYKVLRLLHLNKFLVYASEFNCNDLMVDGIAHHYLNLKTSPILKSQTGNDDVFALNSVLAERKIPDLSILYKEKVISIEDFFEIRNNWHGSAFRIWWNSKDYNLDDLRSELSKKLKKSKISSLVKWLSLNLIGLVQPIVGTAISFGESFLLKRFLSGWNPKLFLDDYLKERIDKKIKDFETKRNNELAERYFGKVGRNDPCPCKSGKKFKHCHGK